MRPRLLVLALTTVLLLAPLLDGGAPGSPPIQRVPPVELGLPHPAGLLPTGSAGQSYWYTQVGASLEQENGSSASGQLTDLVEQVTLVTSPYPIGYELNGLSSTGDWYQVLVTDNWGGCNSGFEMTYEVWDNTGGSQAPVCDPTLVLSTGDSVRLALVFPSSSRVCLEARDLTTGLSQNDCQTQPDTGATGFDLLAGGSNGNGYFTGPMTEIANPNPTSCPDYRNMPVIDYRWPAAFHVTGYVPFSDEFEYGGAGSVCYSSGDGVSSIAAGDPTTQYVDTASGTSYGPHEVAGQNFTYVDPTVGWRLLTDPPVLTGVTLDRGGATVALGATVELNASVTGGTPPYGALWEVDGTFAGPHTASFNWTATSSGSHLISAFGLDAHGQVIGPASVSFDVPSHLVVGVIRTSTGGPGLDVGEVAYLDSSVTGGFPPYSYVWSGLPPGCLSNDFASVLCVPTSVGGANVSVTVTDTNHTVLASPMFLLIVSPWFGASLSQSRVSLDVGQAVDLNLTSTGGLIPAVYTWQELPTGCTASAAPSLTCSPTSTGLWQALASVSDANGMRVNLSGPETLESPAPSVADVASRTTSDAGGSIVLSATVAGGYPPWTFQWTGLPPNCPTGPTDTTVECAFPAGSSEVNLTATDGNGVQVVPAPLFLGVYPALSGTSTGEGTYSFGEALTVQVSVSGGSGGYQYTWQNLPPGCSVPGGAELECTPSEAGQFNVTVIVQDAEGGVVHLQIPLSVVSVCCAAPTPASSVPWLALIAAAVLVVAVTGILVVRRGRGAAPPRNG